MRRTPPLAVARGLARCGGEARLCAARPQVRETLRVNFEGAVAVPPAPPPPRDRASCSVVHTATPHCRRRDPWGLRLAALTLSQVSEGRLSSPAQLARFYMQESHNLGEWLCCQLQMPEGR